MDKKKVVDTEELITIGSQQRGLLGRLSGWLSAPRIAIETVAMGRTIMDDERVLGGLLKKMFDGNNDGTVGIWKKTEKDGKSHNDFLVSGATVDVILTEIEDRTALTGGPLKAAASTLRESFEKCADRRAETTHLKPVLSVIDILKARDQKKPQGGFGV